MIEIGFLVKEIVIDGSRSSHLYAIESGFQSRRAFVLRLGAGAIGGHHSHERGTQLIWALEGSVELYFHNFSSSCKKIVTKSHAVEVGAGVWRMYYSARPSVILVLCEDLYSDAPPLDWNGRRIF